MKRTSEKKDEMVSTAKLYKLKLVPKLKASKLFKLQLIDMKANSSILMGLEMVGTSQK